MATTKIGTRGLDGFVNDDPSKWNGGMYNSQLLPSEVQTNINSRKPLKYGTSHMMNTWTYEPRRQNHFELQICNMNWIGSMEERYRDSTNKHNSKVNTGEYASPFLTLSLNNFTMPDLKIGKVSVAYGNSKIFYAGVPDYGDFNITFNDFVGLSTETILCAWFNRAYDPITEQLAYSTAYKKTAYLIEYNVDGSCGGCWKIEGLWMTSFKPGQYSQEGGNNVRKLDCTFSYDRIYPYSLQDMNMYSTYVMADGVARKYM